ncbi:ABC transporter ATP-binding protein [Peptococcaceae bacterium]|nr:ABC transporter ATP-binding protein [Peptococcaceae bacterium]
MIELISIVKKFGNKTVLKNIGFKVNAGEIMVLLGGSGGGKTTLLNIIAGLIKQDAGDVIIKNKLVNDVPPEKRNVGFVFQDYALFPHKNVFDNIAFGLRLKNLKRDLINRKVNKIMEMLNITELARKYIDELSGGQKQRVALARAIVLNPDVLLLDEPLSALDPMLREKLRTEIKEIIKSTGVTAVYVTHDLSEAMAVGDKIAILNKGEIMQLGTVNDVLYHPKNEFVANFVGANNVLKGKVVEFNESETIIEFKELKALKITMPKYPILERKKEMYFCIHPENIFIGTKYKNVLNGEIENIIPVLQGLRVVVNVHGIRLFVLTSKNSFNYKIGDKIWLSFKNSSIHPLCGKRSKLDGKEFPFKCIKSAV